MIFRLSNTSKSQTSYKVTQSRKCKTTPNNKSESIKAVPKSILQFNY